MATTVGDGAWSHVSDILGLANHNAALPILGTTTTFFDVYPT